MPPSDPPAIAEFLAAFDAAVEAGVAPPATLSERLLGRSSRVADIRGGGDVGCRTLFRATETLAALTAQAATAPSRRRSRLSSLARAS